MGARRQARHRTVLLVAMLLLSGACATDAAGPSGSGEPSDARPGEAPPAQLEGTQVTGPCDPTVRVGDGRVNIGGAGWDASDYPLEPPIAPPPGSCIRSVNDMPLDDGDAGPFGVRLWYYAVPQGTDVATLCSAALSVLESDRPAGMNPDPCVPTQIPSIDPRLGPSVSHRLDVLRRDDVVVTVIASEVTSACDADPEEENDDELQDCLTMLVGFLRYG